MNDWRFRESLFAAAHRWPLILAFILAGSLLGWLAAFAWPSPYRASLEISVGLNPYRALEDRYVAAFAQAEFRNVDDYKYWQMQQLNGLALSDEYLQETLSRLRHKDPSWGSVEAAGLRQMLAVYWRNAGQWRLVAEHRDPQMAGQAVQAWRDVIIENANLALTHSRELYRLDLLLRSLTDARLESQSRFQQLEGISRALSAWQNDLSHLPPSQSMSQSDYWLLWSLAAGAAGPDQNWRMLLEEIPPEQAPAEDFLPWLERLAQTIEAEMQSLEARLDSLAQEHDGVSQEWERSLQAGQGLAATLEIEPSSNAAPSVERPRPVALTALVGGGLGFLMYCLYSLAIISRSAEA
jgi:hypothetical protein